MEYAHNVHSSTWNSFLKVAASTAQLWTQEATDATQVHEARLIEVKVCIKSHDVAKSEDYARTAEHESPRPFFGIHFV